MMVKKGILFVVYAPSGAGKTTLVSSALEDLKEYCLLERVVTYTSKKPRPGDRDAYDYYFLDEQDFEKKIEQKFFLEWSKAYNNYYGSPSWLLEKLGQGNSYIIIMDRCGAKRIKELYDRTVLIWITVSDIAVLEQRLTLRNTETPQQCRYRLLLAQEEIALEEKEKLYHYNIDNTYFDFALKSIKNIIINEIEKRD